MRTLENSIGSHNITIILEDSLGATTKEIIEVILELELDGKETERQKVLNFQKSKNSDP